MVCYMHNEFYVRSYSSVSYRVPPRVFIATVLRTLNVSLFNNYSFAN